jgi:hypothetical protein
MRTGTLTLFAMIVLGACDAPRPPPPTPPASLGVTLTDTPRGDDGVRAKDEAIRPVTRPATHP